MRDVRQLRHFDRQPVTAHVCKQQCVRNRQRAWHVTHGDGTRCRGTEGAGRDRADRLRRGSIRVQQNTGAHWRAPARLQPYAAPRRAAFHAVKSQLVFAAPPAPDEELMHDLRARFKGEVEAVSEYLDRDLVALWGYDRLD